MTVFTKVLLLFIVTFMIFFLYFVPIIWPFSSTNYDAESTGTAYAFWYIMVFILSLLWGDIVYKKGCWFFQK